MLPSQRESVILNLLQQRQVIAVEDICTQCNCSPVTARRDLTRLEQLGLVRRTHGGAIAVSGIVPEPCGSANLSALEARLALLDRSDALIVTPSNTSATRVLVERARRAGVPIIAEAIRYPGAQTVVAIDDYRAGVELGRWLGGYAREHLSGHVEILELTHALPNTEARTRGFEHGLREVLPEVRFKLRLDGQGLRSTVREIAADAVSVHSDVNVIFAINDDTALGAMDAFRAAGVDQRRLVVVWFGLEGKETRELLEQEGAFKACVAMFPEVVGRACVDAAVCIYHNCSVPDRILTPYTIVTAESLDHYYARDPSPEGWVIRRPTVAALPTCGAGFSLLDHSSKQQPPARIGWVQIFSSHEWYRNVRRAMQERSRDLGIQLEVLDASHDMAQEVDTLKRIIGCAAARLVDDGDTIILDGGETTLYMARALHGRRGVTVITNSVPVLAELSQEPGITLLSSGGAVRPESRVLAGPSAEATFSSLRADKAFVSGSGLSLDFGLSDTNVQEAGVKQVMLRAARETILLADHTKIGTEALVRIAPIGSLHRLVTDAGISSHDRTALIRNGIEVIVADERG